MTRCNCLCALAVLAALQPATLTAQGYPQWWIDRGVVVTNAATLTNDYAALNSGQLKWMATNAFNELEERLPGGAGSGVRDVLAEFSPSNNYLGVNLGQLKHVAAPFYERLSAAGCTNAYPWTTNTFADDADFASANIGQLKFAFCFQIDAGAGPGPDSDGDGMPDSWETNYFGSAAAADPDNGAYDVDHDGVPNLYECLHSTDPTNAANRPAPDVIVTPTNGVTLQAAIDAAENDYEIICVADGVYTGAGNRDITFDGKTILLMSENGPAGAIIDCEGKGRAFYLYNETGLPAISGFTIRKGSAGSIGGGAVYAYGSTFWMSGCVLERNGLTGRNIGQFNFRGGAVYCQNSAKASFFSCRFLNNYVLQPLGYGGAVSFYTGTTGTFWNCLLVANESSEAGAAIDVGGSVALYNCTIVSNSCSRVAAGDSAAFKFSHDLALTNTIVWGNRPASEVVSETHIKAGYCDSQDAWTGPGNLSTNPMFVADGFHLKAGSACIAAGVATPCVFPDFDGDERAGAVDIGVDEFVDADGDGLPNWFESQYGATNAAEDIDGDSLTAAAEYEYSSSPTNTDSDADGLADNSELALGSSPRLADTDGDGMWDGWEIAHGLEPRCRLDAALDGDKDHVPNLYEFIYRTDPADGTGTNVPPPTIVVTNGGAVSIRQALERATNGYEIILLSGIYTNSGDRNLDLSRKNLLLMSTNGPRATAIDCRQSGRAIAVSNIHVGVGAEYRPVFSGLGIQNGYVVGGNGGGIALEGSDALFSDCLMASNVAVASAPFDDGRGGGVFVHHAAPVFDRCAFVANEAENGGYGGGVAYEYPGVNHRGELLFRSCLFVRNQGMRGGGCYLWDGRAADFLNCTLAANACLNLGGAVCVESAIYMTNTVVFMTNSIVWANLAALPSYWPSFSAPTVRVGYSDVEGGFAGSGNINTNPLFGGGMYHLRRESPCIAAGTTNVTTCADIDGENRVVTNGIDLGADEFVDSDGDGMPDWYEAFYALDNSFDDPDGDGLTNLLEYAQNTLPFNTDTDGDGLTDGDEVNIFGTDPTVWTIGGAGDADHDGLGDAEEYSAGTSPFNADSDGDGMSDGWEVRHGLDPVIDDGGGDPDADGTGNLEEFHYGLDPHSADSDGDGLSDRQELTGSVYGYLSDPANADSDGDGLTDGQDVFTSSPQGDQDGDGSANAADADDDNDAVADASEAGNGAFKPDRDFDGVPDGKDYAPDNPGIWQDGGNPDVTAPTIAIQEPQQGAEL